MTPLEHSISRRSVKASCAVERARGPGLLAGTRCEATNRRGVECVNNAGPTARPTVGSPLTEGVAPTRVMGGNPTAPCSTAHE